ncbi:hypothetical protein CPB83DRAFT_860440 [Crepidotus variabilis]|uniref:DUF6535 domain-containing protein n=1 Tax=Crepidotus variabilis TaxID=179855 RepID=A0A9P6E9G2_9AGAR|nr:hypothetical protein CPB83DRAFT_860440 [Crepidotus variabilis]
MSFDIERQPVRLDSQATRVDVEIAAIPRHLHSHVHGNDSIWDSTEKLGRYSFNQASQTDHSFNAAPRRQVRIPNLKGPSPLPGSQPDFHEQSGEVPWHCGDPHRYGTPKKGDSWHKCHKLTEKYDNEMCDAWKEEVDKLLIFAGLFSATVTAFTVESYKWLQEDEQDISVRLLAFIAGQVSNSSTLVPSNLVPPPFQVRATDVRVNAAWFLSLTLSLTTVLIGILCLQWLREFQRDAALPHKEAVALRQMRYEGLIHWKVPQFLSALPVLLQGSLILFFIGLLDLLWDRNVYVAVAISIVVGFVLIFLGVTTLLPALQHAFTKDRHMRVHQCPYKSPQSWLAYRIGHTCFALINKLRIPFSSDSTRFHRLLKSVGDLNWMMFDMRWRQYRDAGEVYRGTAKKLKDSEDIIHGLQWLNSTFTQSVDAVYPIYHCLGDLELSAAATTMEGFYLGGLMDNATLKVMLDDRFSPTEFQKREILSAYYLHLHQDRHSVLKSSYLETLVRILNSQEVPRPFYDWLSEILQELASSFPSSDSTTTFSLLNPEITVQVLLCMKKLMVRNSLRTLDLVVAWALLHQLLSPSILESSEDRPVGVNVNRHHLKLACGIFEEFEQWITKGREIERCDRVKLCAEGMMTVFPPLVDLEWLSTLSSDMVKARSLVRALDREMDLLGGPGTVILKEKRWWLDYWEVYTETDWENLLQTFNVTLDDDPDL